VDVIAALTLVGVLIAAGALFFKWRADKRESQEVEDRRAREKAAMSSKLISDGAIPDEWLGRRAYRFGITNKGRSWASDVDGFLVDQDDRDVSDFSFTHSRIAGLPPGESDELTVVVKDDYREVNPLRLKVTWYGSADQEEYWSRQPIPPD
jgi:hypothetical protein